MEKQQREWEDLATTAATQWSPILGRQWKICSVLGVEDVGGTLRTLFADKQKEKDRLIRQCPGGTRSRRVLQDS